jgi:excisionase family DNA binding protein
MPDFITVTQAARQAALNVSTIRYAILAGRLSATKYGKTWLITPTEFERWLSAPELHKAGARPKR